MAKAHAARMHFGCLPCIDHDVQRIVDSVLARPSCRLRSNEGHKLNVGKHEAAAPQAADQSEVEAAVAELFAEDMALWSYWCRAEEMAKCVYVRARADVS